MNNLAAFTAEGYGVLLFAKLIFGAIAVFFGILTWHKTRKSYMIFFVFGIFALYISILLQTAGYFGFIILEPLKIENISLPLWHIFFETLPVIFFITALSLFLKSEGLF